MAIGRGITDAFSAYVAPEMLSKARERITNLPARQFGIGGDKFANRVTQETLSDPRMSWLKAEQGLTESQANDLFWSEGASPSPSPAVTPSPSPTVTSSSTISKTPADPVNQRAIISQHLNNQPVLTPVNPTAPVQPNVLTQAMQPPYKQDRTTYRSPDSIRMEQWKNLLLKNGNPTNLSSQKLVKAMQQHAINIIIDLHDGKEWEEVMTCDFSYDYVKINAEYTT